MLFLSLGLITAVAIQTWKIFPYYISEKSVPDAVLESESSENTVGILIANVLIENRRSSDLLQIIKDTDPDMLLLMETDDWWISQLQPLKDAYPFFMEYPLENAYGMALYSKLHLEDPEIKFLKHDDVPSIHTKVVLQSKKIFMFHGVHPVAPVPSKEYPDNVGEKEVELETTAKIVKKDSLPAIVAGDFNDVSWSNASMLFQENGGLNNVRIGRGLYNSFSAKSVFLRWPLDHYFVTDDIALVELERLSDFGSDHFPLYARLMIKSQ